MTTAFHRHLACLLLAALILLCGGSTTSAAMSELQVKSGIIVNVLKNVVWPADTFASKSAPITIYVMGNGVLNEVADVLLGKTVQNRTIVVKQATSAMALEDCQVLMINSSEQRKVRNILDTMINIVGDKVLTISDIDNFAKLGGIVGLGSKDGRIKIEVNLRSTRGARLTLNPELLNAATIIAR